MIYGNWTGHGLRWAQRSIIQWTTKKVTVFREHTKILKAASWKVVPPVVTGSGVHFRVHEAVKDAGGGYLTTLSTATSIQRRWPLRMKYDHGGENRGTRRKSYPCATSCTTKSKMAALRSNLGYRGQRPPTDRLSGELQTKGWNQSTSPVARATAVWTDGVANQYRCCKREPVL